MPFSKPFPNISDSILQNELGAMIFTSRHAGSDALVSDESSSAIKLHGRDRDDAILLLTQRGKIKDFGSKDASEIVEKLAYHPLANLASTYDHQGRLKEAEERWVRVMEMRKRVLELKHPHTLESMANLATTFCSQR